MRFKRSLVDPTTERTEQAWAKIGVEQFHGRARFVDSTTLVVGADRLTGRRVLVAAGARPAPLTFPGADRLATSDEFLNLDDLPPRIVFVGGGYIAFEFAHVAARAGVEVTILHRGARPLDAFDPDLVDLLVRRTRDLGIRVELDTEVRGVEAHADHVTVLGCGVDSRAASRRIWRFTPRVGSPISMTSISTRGASSGISAASS